MPSHPLGELLQRYQDQHGPVTVYQRQQQRFLTFGNAVEQSVIDLARPHRLEHVYTQAMMLGVALSADAANTLLLGLGGGSLVRALRKITPHMRIDAVEQSAAVIQAARDWFELDEDSYLQLHCGDAEAFVQVDQAHYDLLMLDLYLAEGVHPAQTEIDFLQRCHDRLSDNGILLANHWCSEFRDSQRAHEAMRAVFDERALYLQVRGGNTIAFGFRGELPRLRPNDFFRQAQQLGLALNIPLQQLARNFWRQNTRLLRSR